MGEGRDEGMKGGREELGPSSELREVKVESGF